MDLVFYALDGRLNSCSMVTHVQKISFGVGVGVVRCLTLTIEDNEKFEGVIKGKVQMYCLCLNLLYLLKCQEVENRMHVSG